jgi:tetratricopeptide (TPR) repeat protein
MALDGKDVEAYSRRGVAEYQLGKYHDAVTDLTSALKIEPSNAFALRNRGLASLALGAYSATVDDERQSIASEAQTANNAIAYDAMGDALVALGRKDEAIDAYQHVLTIDPNDADTKAKIERLRSGTTHPKIGLGLVDIIAAVDPFHMGRYTDLSKGAPPPPSGVDAKVAFVGPGAAPDPPPTGADRTRQGAASPTRAERAGTIHQQGPRDPTSRGRGGQAALPRTVPHP